MRYYLIAGEASGDLHGSNLMNSLKANDPNSEFRFWGGDLMSSVDPNIVRHYKDTAVMGIVEVLSKLKKILSNIKDCKEDILKYKPDVLILIDYPGFNLKIAKFAKKNGIKVFYYISPKVWAWKEGRVKQLKEYVDQLFIIFPFEIDYFKKKGIDAIYLGNPLLDKVLDSPAMKETRPEFYSRHDLKDDGKQIIALLAGSRKMEINFLVPIFLKLEKLLSDKYTLLLAGAPSIDISYYQKLLGDSKIKIIQNDTYACVKQARFAIVSSGTASLETTIIGTPQVVCYGLNKLSYAIGKLLVKVPFISLANLILNKLAFKELIQDEANAQNIHFELSRLVDDGADRQTMLDDYTKIIKLMGEKGSANRIAKKMIDLLH